MALKAYSVAKDGATYISKNFRVREFRCQDGSDVVFIESDLVDILQKIRDHFAGGFQAEHKPPTPCRST